MITPTFIHIPIHHILSQAPSNILRDKTTLKYPRHLHTRPNTPKVPLDISLDALLPPCIDLVKYQDLNSKASNSVFPLCSLYDNF